MMAKILSLLYYYNIIILVLYNYITKIRSLLYYYHIIILELYNYDHRYIKDQRFSIGMCIDMCLDMCQTCVWIRAHA